jgi:hypothetical protein
VVAACQRSAGATERRKKPSEVSSLAMASAATSRVEAGLAESENKVAAA